MPDTRESTKSWCCSREGKTNRIYQSTALSTLLISEEERSVDYRRLEKEKKKKALCFWRLGDLSIAKTKAVGGASLCMFINNFYGHIVKAKARARDYNSTLRGS